MHKQAELPAPLSQTVNQTVTALICTCGRGAAIATAVASVLASSCVQFELIVVDQNRGSETEDVLRPFRADPRFRYLRSPTQGKGRALNIGIEEACGEVVVITDDDCVVPPHWLETMFRAFQDHPTAAAAFCSVEAAPYNPALGFVPTSYLSGSVLLSGVFAKCRSRGMGAGISVSRTAVLALGGFDEMLGPGGRFPSCDDNDIVVRALLGGYSVYETDAVAVSHSGFRTWEEGKILVRRDWFAIGAAYAKPLKCGHWLFAAVVLYELCRNVFRPPLVDLCRFRRPRGLGRIAAFARGFAQGLCVPVDPKTLLFKPAASTTKEEDGSEPLPHRSWTKS